MPIEDTREWLTICLDCQEPSHLIYNILVDGKWRFKRIIDIKEYRINGTLCPECKQARAEAYEAKQRFPHSDRWTILRSYGHDDRGCI